MTPATGISAPDRARYVASGGFPGSIGDQFQLDEHDGHLRIASTNTNPKPSSRLGITVPMGLLRVTGRRTGRRYEIPVGVWESGDGFVIFSDAPWLQNFRGGAVAELVLRGQTRPVHGKGR